MPKALFPRREKTRMKVALCALAVMMLSGCASNETKQPNTSDRQRVIVKIRLSEDAGKNTAREKAANILSQLEPKVRKTARTFELLPLIAVEADAKTLMQLLRMPEVESIQPDLEIKPFDSPAMKIPIAPSGTTK